MEKEISKFEEMPEALNYLIRKVESLAEKVGAMSCTQKNANEQSEWLDIEALCAYLPTHPAKQTVYTWVNEMSIPFYKSSKKLLFLRSEIDDWLRQGRRKNNEELRHEAAEFIRKKKGGTR